jgi:hypothetical protein
MPLQDSKTENVRGLLGRSEFCSMRLNGRVPFGIGNDLCGIDIPLS